MFRNSKQSFKGNKKEIHTFIDRFKLMIEVNQLSFSYNKRKSIIKDVSFRVPTGSIYGFLGANGAGKTTTIRLLLNLMKAEKGNINIGGTTYEENPSKILKKTGTLIENTSFYGQLSAKANLQIWANYYQVPSSRIEETLKLVGLYESRHMKVKKYSQGMKQRLGIATALLHDPDLLILDEPLNGLDPKGIAEMRELFFSLKSEGKTILLSSHILAEIEATCDQLCILDKGILKFDGTVEELRQVLAKKIQFELKGNAPEQMLEYLKTKFDHSNPEKVDEHIVVELESEKDISKVIKALVEQRFEIYEVRKKVNRLEDLYLSITNPEENVVD